jgi:hypothetical protein
MRRHSILVLSAAAISANCGIATACPSDTVAPTAPPKIVDPTTASKPDSQPGYIDTSNYPEWVARLAPVPDSPEAKAYAAAQKTRLVTEKELKLLRAKYFKQLKNERLRQPGYAQLRQYTDPAIYPSLIEIFGSEDEHVQAALADHFAEIKTDEADAALAWCAVFGSSKSLRDIATTRLVARTKEAGSVSNRVQTVIAGGLRSRDEATIASAAQTASTLKLFEAIPALINAQVGVSGGGSTADNGAGALAYILVGTQQAFVSGLTPIVGDSAVAFNPQLSVLTEGTILRVIDAHVITYRTEVHAALASLAQQAWGGQQVDHGWDNRAWAAWYANELVPYRKQLADQRAPSASSGG